MSIDFTILCRAPLPQDWRSADEIALGELPFHFGIEEVETWREEIQSWLAGVNEPDEFETELEALLSEPWSFVGQMNCRPVAAGLADVCAEALAGAFGGVYYDDHSRELRRGAGKKVASGAEMVACWNRLAKDHATSEERRRVEAQAKWREAAQADPGGFAEANDWSDVLAEDKKK
jgi:hypothetical protein